MTKPSSKLVMPFGLMYGRDLTDAQKVTAMWIIHYASRGTTNTCMASNQTLSICTGKSERQVRRDISSLCKAGYMRAEERGSNWPSVNKRFDRTRYITLDAKVFKMPEQLAKETGIADPEMSGGEDMDVHLYSNNNKDYPLKEKTIALASLSADIKPFQLHIGRPFSGVVIGNRVLPTRAEGIIIGAGGDAAAPTPPAADRLSSLFWYRVQKLKLPPRVEQVVMRMLDDGHTLERILIDRNVVTLQKEGQPMADKKTMPTQLSLHELLQKVDEGSLLRKPAKVTGSMQTSNLSKRLREITGKIQFVAQHTTRQMGQLKQFMRVVQSAHESPEDVLEVVATNWHEFGYHLQMAGKMKPKELFPDPGVLAYLAQECVNFYRKRKAGHRPAAPAPQEEAPAATPARGMVIGRPPAMPDTPRAPAATQGQGSGVMSSNDFLEMVKRIKGN